MKVGIVSQYNNDNLGNKLQNYALQQKLLEYADEVVTIKNKSKPQNAFDYLKRYSFAAESVFLNRMMKKRRNTRFLQFHHRHIRDNGKTYCFEEREPSLRKKDRCDLYCAGSDQNWKPTTGRTGAFSYLGFADRDATFSYAASFGVDRIPAEYEEAVRRGVRHIKYISVREDAGKRIVEELTGRTDVQVLVDPTMLLSGEEWDKVASKPKHGLPEKYLLTYFLGDVSPERRAAVQAKAKAFGCQIIELMDPNSPYYAIGPGEFVYLIKHAALVCTDSFHGSVFSFLYQRPLAILDRQGAAENMSSRLETLASKFSLKNCIAVGDCLPDIPAQPDYSVGFAALEEERKKAEAFLNMVFYEAEKAGLCK